MKYLEESDFATFAMTIAQWSSLVLAVLSFVGGALSLLSFITGGKDGLLTGLGSILLGLVFMGVFFLFAKVIALGHDE